MKVAINGLFLKNQNTGGGRYLVELINGFKDYARDIDFSIFLNQRSNQRLNFNPNFDRINCGYTVNLRPLRILWENFSLPKILSQRKIDIFHAASFTLPKGLKCKSVITIFDMTFFTLPQVHQKSKVLYFRKMIPLALKRADKIIAISKQTKSDIISVIGTNPEKIEVIPVGIGPEFKVLPKNGAAEDIKNKYHLGQKYILFVGTIEPRKNLIRLIEAFDKLKKGGVEHKLAIIGKFGWGYHAILNKITSLKLQNDVIFTNYITQEDMPLIYNAAELFVYPSLYEGFGIPVLEAMACGLPIITSNTSAMPEIASGCAILVDPLDVEAIFLAMDTILKNQPAREKIIFTGIERAKSFTCQAMAENTVKIYKSMLENN